MSDNRKASFTNDVRIYGSVDYRPAVPIKFTVPLNLPGWQPPAPGELPPLPLPPSISRKVESPVGARKEVAQRQASAPKLKPEPKPEPKPVVLAKPKPTVSKPAILKPVILKTEERPVSVLSLPKLKMAHYSPEFRKRVTARIFEPGAKLGIIGMEEGVQWHTLMQWRAAARKAAKVAALTGNAEAGDESAQTPAKRVPMSGGLYALARK